MQMFAVFVMGMTSILAQTTSLRRLLTVFSGNELDIGITLAVWLACVGAGSFAGRRLRTSRVFAISFFLVGLLVPATVLLISLIRPVFGIAAGETVPFSITLISTIVSLAPLCVAIGAQYPLAVSFLQGDASKAYALEASGAFLGGLLFTFGLSGRIEALTIATAVSFINVLLFIVLLGKKRRLLILLIPLLLHAGAERIGENAPEQDLELVRQAESRYGELAVYESNGQFSLFSSGRFAFAYPDSQSEELIAHVPMSLFRLPAKVLLIGGSPAVAREFLKYPDAQVAFAEIDPAMIELSLGILGQEDRARLRDARFAIVPQDARNYLKSAPGTYDLIVLNLPEPATANVNRFYTVEFFREAGAALNAGGMLALRLPASHGYIGRRMQAANGSVYRSLRSVFRFVALTSEEYGGMFASNAALSAGPEAPSARFSERGISTSSFYPQLFQDIFDPIKVGNVVARLDQAGALNRDRQPAAYLYNLQVWSDMLGSSVVSGIFEMRAETLLTAVAGLLIAVTAVLWKRKQAVPSYALFTTGYASTSFSVVLLLAYQAAYGCVYEKIGLLTALFMAGAALGAYAHRGRRNILSSLLRLDCAAVALLAVSPLLLSREPLFFLLMTLAGAIGGAQFALANDHAEAAARENQPGFLYALDLGGAAPGALATAVLTVPLIGIPRALLLLAFVKCSSLILLMSPLARASTKQRSDA